MFENYVNKYFKVQLIYGIVITLFSDGLSNNFLGIYIFEIIIILKTVNFNVVNKVETGRKVKTKNILRVKEQKKI